MTIQEWFDKRKEAQIERRAKDLKGIDVETPELWAKCVHCESQILKSELEENLMVCPHCDYHFRINARTRIAQLFDDGSFEEMFNDYDISTLADQSMTKEELISVLEQFYTKEKQKKYGVLGIRIDLI